MFKMTLLEMTQNILSAIGGDNVNSISDTQESWDVSQIIRETYAEIFSHTELPERKGFIQLEGLSDTTKPNYLKIPDDVLRIDWFKYRNLSTDQYVDLAYMCPEQFVSFVTQQGRESLVTITDTSGATFFIQNNQSPTYFTILDDKYIVTDSWNSALENTLHQNNTLAYGEKTIPWVHEDTFIPPIDAELFPRLLAEAKSVTFFNIKNVVNTKEEARARRQLIRFQKFKDKQRPRFTTDFSRKR